MLKILLRIENLKLNEDCKLKFFQNCNLLLNQSFQISKYQLLLQTAAICLSNNFL